MTTNPDSIVRVRARNGGRASVYEANAWAQSFSTGIMDGTGVRQNTSADMNVLVGGTTTNPDVVIASNPAGYKIALDIVGTHTVAITAPASNKRIASVVAYTDDLSIVSTETSVTGSPASCGLIVVNGDTSSSPVAPTDAMIRAAITADGATGTQASYAVIANVAVDSSTSMVTDSLITNLRSGVTADKIDFTTFGFQWSAPIDAGYTPEVESLTGNSVTVGAGTWLIVLKCVANFDSSHPVANHDIRIRQSSVSGTEIAYGHVWSESGGDDMVNLAIGKATVTTNTTFVGTHAASPDSWLQTQNCMMFALRVG